MIEEQEGKKGTNMVCGVDGRNGRSIILYIEVIYFDDA